MFVKIYIKISKYHPVIYRFLCVVKERTIIITAVICLPLPILRNHLAI